MLPDIQQWIELLGGLYDQYGYLIVFLGSFGENTAFLGLFLPGGTLALLGAFYARLGTLNLALVILFATLGTVLGYHIDYLLGRFVLTRFVSRWGNSRLGRRLRLAARLRLARKMLTRHGGKAILISHTIGHMRSFVAMSAGITHMRYPRFLAFEVLAALLWNTLYGLLGYFIGMEINTLETLLQRAGWGILGLLLIILLIWRFLWPRIKRQRRPSARGAKNAALS
jgi:membrane protein DedA with SNARE-associated domain